jgi:hypothetical protein
MRGDEVVFIDCARWHMRLTETGCESFSAANPDLCRKCERAATARTRKVIAHVSGAVTQRFCPKCGTRIRKTPKGVYHELCWACRGGRKATEAVRPGL